MSALTGCVFSREHIHPVYGFSEYRIPGICTLFRVCNAVSRFLGYAYFFPELRPLVPEILSELSPDICPKVAYCRNARDGARRQTLDLEQKWLQTNSRFLGYAYLSSCATAGAPKSIRIKDSWDMHTKIN